ncbi:RNA-directed DNA polymerase, eukaryota [Tanacetum coccineum]
MHKLTSATMPFVNVETRLEETLRLNINYFKAFQTLEGTSVDESDDELTEPKKESQSSSANIDGSSFGSQKKSGVVRGRFPLVKDPNLDYEIDSDEEWEEDEPWESLSDLKGDVEITEQPLSKIDIHSVVIDLHDGASIQAYPSILSIHGEDVEWVAVELKHPKSSNDDWIGVFSPAQSMHQLVSSARSNSRVLEEAENSVDRVSSESFSNGVKIKEGGSILEILEEMITVGQTMCFSMEGYTKDMEKIIGTQGEQLVFR